MTTYKLTYFNSRGKAEGSRLVFVQAGVEYEDKRVGQEEWVQVKASSPTGMLPMLEVDGRQLTGSGVIARFLGERLGLAGNNDIENAELAGISDVLSDFLPSLMAAFSEKDGEKKAQLMKKLEEEDVPKYWGIIERRCEKNGSMEGWIYGNTPTYIDLGIFHILEYVAAAIPSFLKNFPHVAKLKAAVEALPRVAEWLEKRPKTDH
jgi:glutathione S-transferase